jgi:hypothetical protein
VGVIAQITRLGSLEIRGDRADRTAAGARAWTRCARGIVRRAGSAQGKLSLAPSRV